jgi:hypothetical protein
MANLSTENLAPLTRELYTQRWEVVPRGEQLYEAVATMVGYFANGIKGKLAADTYVAQLQKTAGESLDTPDQLQETVWIHCAARDAAIMIIAESN